MIDKDDPRLTAYLLGELDAAEHDEIVSALAIDPELRCHVDELRSTIDAIHHAILHDPMDSNRRNANEPAIDELTTDQIATIESAAVESAAVESVSPVSQSESIARMWWRRLAIAALLLYAVGATCLAVWRPQQLPAVVLSGTHPVTDSPVTDSPVTDGHAEVLGSPVDQTITPSIDMLAVTEQWIEQESVGERSYADQQEPSATFGVGGLSGSPASDDFVRDQLRLNRGEDVSDLDGNLRGLSSQPMHDEYEVADRLMENEEQSIAELSNFFHYDSTSEVLETNGGHRFGELEPKAWAANVDRPWLERFAAPMSPGADGEVPSPEWLSIQLPALAFDDRKLSRLDTSEPEGRPNVSFQLNSGNKPDPVAATWKPASASTNRARLSIGHHDDLLLAARDTYVRIDGFRARVMFDLYYYNDRAQQLEGQFLLRLPDDAALHYFAFGPANLPSTEPFKPAPSNHKDGSLADQTSSDGTVDSPAIPAASAITALRRQTESIGSDLALRAMSPLYQAGSESTFGSVKPAWFTTKQQAALAYEETVRRRVDPALVEWAGPGIFQTKVFPLLPATLHRIVIGYDVTLSGDGTEREFQLDLPEQEAGGRVEFDLATLAGMQATFNPPCDPFVSGGRAYYRYESAAPRDYQVSISGAPSVLLQHQHQPGQGGADGGSSADSYFAAQAIAELPDQQAKVDSRRAVFLLDTSWSDRPESFSRRLKLIEEILTNNRDTIDQFSVMMFNVRPYWWKTQWVDNDEGQWNEFKRFADDLALEGATDLHAALVEATSPEWQQTDDESTALPNLFMISDCIATWGATDLATLSQPFSGRAADQVGGALFAYSLSGAPNDRVTMEWLAETSGGAVFHVGDDAQVSNAATAHRSRPWRLVTAQAGGADEVLVDGGSDSIYPGQPLLIAGRGQLSGSIELVFRRGEETLTQVIESKQRIQSPTVARLYGGIAVDRLLPYEPELDEITIAFSRHFRVPGRSCSLVMLESESDYERFGVNTTIEDDQLLIASSSVAGLVSDARRSAARERSDSRSRFIDWVQSLESASLVKVPTALRLAIDRMPPDSFRFTTRPLNCRAFRISDYRQPYRDELAAETLDFDVVMAECEESLIAYGADDAIKTASSLVESNPADIGTLRSVAFRAIDWNRGDQAAPLLWRIALARPYQPQSLMLLGRSFAESGSFAESIVCLDLVASGKWNDRWSSSNQIAKVELLSVLTQFELTQMDSAQSPIAGYARARLRQLRNEIASEGIDLAVLMHWNTDRTDVDLHVTEPAGEECFYKNRSTKAGGMMTADVTEGLGPEMYTSLSAADGLYRVQAKYFRSDQNRSKAPTELLVTVIRDLGRDSMTSQTKRMKLDGQQDLETVTTIEKDSDQSSSEGSPEK